MLTNVTTINKSETITGTLYSNVVKYKIKVNKKLNNAIELTLCFQLSNSSLHKFERNNPVGIPSKIIKTYNISFIIIYLSKVYLKELWKIQNI